MIYYRRYIGDYLLKTMRLSMLEDGAYGRLLDHYYNSEKPLPKDIDEIFDIARATRPEEKKAVRKVLDLKFELGDDGYHNDRADSEIRISQKARKNGGGKGGDDGTE